MSLTPRTLFAVEDDGLIRRLDFSDSDEENHLNLSNDLPQVCREVSPFMEVNSPSTDESMNSSTDSVMSRPKTKRLTPHSKVDTTPPYRRVRALRLFGSPQSPKTLLKQSELTNAVNGVTLKDRPVISTPKPQPFDKGQYNLVRDKLTNSVFKNPFSPLDGDISLFCPGSATKRRRQNEYRSSFNSSSDRYDNDVDGECHPTKRLHLREGCMSRYETEFVQVEQIGFGEFGSVYKCLHKLDGCVYAIKKSKKPLKGTSDERVALNEVWAHAVLGKHKHVVRYFSAWAENDHMLIQNEYCDGGSLAEAIEKNRAQNRIFSEIEVKKILLHIALGLRYIHSLRLAHMDIKPGNIFISLQSNSSLSPDSIDDGFEDGEYVENSFTCKIGDLGHVTQITNPQVEEGDCRYMAPELLQDDYSDLPKADIFALGLTIYEVCGGGPLPKNGDAWHSIRSGKLPHLANYSAELNSLLNKMTHRNPKVRPTSVELVVSRTLAPYQCKTKEQLNKELTQEKCKNRFLQKQLEMMQNSTKKRPILRNNRVLGGKTNRSHSLTSF